MDDAPQMAWADGNREVLRLAFQHLTLLLQGEDADALKFDTQLAVIEARMDGPSELTRICAAFGLDATACDVLLLAALADQPPALSALIENHRLAADGRATPALCEVVLGTSDALAPTGPLRRLGLVSLGPAARFYERPIYVPESVTEALTGRRCLDPEIADHLLPLSAKARPDRDDFTNRLAAAWAQSCQAGAARAFFAGEGDAETLLADFATAALSLGQLPWLLRASTLHETPDFACNLRRDLILSDAALAIDARQAPQVAWGIAESLGLPVLMLGAAPTPGFLGPTLRLPARLTTPMSAWQDLLGPKASARPELTTIASQYDLTAAQWRRAVDSTVAGFAPNLARAARAEIGDQMGHLAQEVTPLTDWDDLILPRAQEAALTQMAQFLQYRDLVTQDWGFAAKSTRGLGMAAVFHGPSGTGKTSAAEALVGRMAKLTGVEVPLYRVNVASLVSKYIGETAKNFAAVFAAGQAMGAALLFDEAEGLFGHRTGSIKDAVDKHSNAELGYLLQSLEAYPGTAILTTNMRGAIDDAFFRRFRFAIEFPFPDQVLRACIWERVLPDALPCEDLDTQTLAGLSLSGGNIRSIALNAAYLAAAAGTRLRMGHLAQAVRQEFAKLEKPAPEAALKGWG